MPSYWHKLPFLAQSDLSQSHTTDRTDFTKICGKKNGLGLPYEYYHIKHAAQKTVPVKFSFVGNRPKTKQIDIFFPASKAYCLVLVWPSARLFHCL